jgi:Protein of unknown function (DUF3606)
MTAHGEDDDAVVEFIDLSDADNVRYWCTRWDVSEDELRTAAEHAGTAEVPAVSLALGRETHR